MSFVDRQIIREDKEFTTSVYRKPTFSGVYTHFESFLPTTYRFGTVFTLAYGYFRICSTWTKLPTELLSLKLIFLENGHTEIVENRCFKRFMDSIHVLKETTLTVEKKPLVI